MRNQEKFLKVCIVFWVASLLWLWIPILFAQTNSVSPQFTTVVHPERQGVGDANITQAPEIEISEGDLLQIAVFDTPELSAQIRVDQQGMINLPWGGNLRVAGMTPGQLGEELQTMLVEQKILRQPHGVTVFVQEYATQGVKVLGQVKSPGIYPYLGSHRLFDMIALAGGVTDFASRTAILIHRGDVAHPVTVQLAYDEKIKDSDVQVLPGDTIIVGKAGVVYVLGDVGRPGGFLLQDNQQQMNVLQALSLAQGINKTAKLNSAVLLRQTPSGYIEYHLRLKKILQGNEENLTLSDHDILYVPSSLSKTLGYRGIEMAAQATAGVIIYRQ